MVKKQLQTCCKHETISLDTVDVDDTSEGFESPPQIRISSPIHETAPFPSLFRRKSFNISNLRSLLTTPESQTPFRKSVESALPLCGAGSEFKPTKLQYDDESSPSPTAAKEVVMPKPSPVAPENPKAKVLHKSGPLPVLQHSPKEGIPGGDPASPLKVKKHLSGPLLGIPRKPSSGMGSPCNPSNLKQASGPLSSGGKPTRQVAGGGPSPNRLPKVKSSQGLFPAVATSKLPGMVTQGTLKKAAANMKQQISPALDRKGSRGSRASNGDSKALLALSPLDKTGTPVRATNHTNIQVSEVDGVNKEVVATTEAVEIITRLNSRNGRLKSKSARERDEIRAAVKIQAAYRGYKVRKRFMFEAAECDNPSRELMEELEETRSVSTQMSKTDVQRRKKAQQPQVSKSWNGSIRTAQDCQALLRSKQEAALKRERAMEYALSRQNWKTGSRSQKGPIWSTDDRLPDKPGWVWSWLERAARMGAHNSQNRIFDNDFNYDEPQSESLSVKSTVGICTTDIGSLDMDLGWPITNQWPLSLRQQHAAGLLQPKTPPAGPSPLQKAAGGVDNTPPPKIVKYQNRLVQTDPVKKNHRGRLQNNCKNDDVSTTTDSCISRVTSKESLDNRPRFGVRKLKFHDYELQDEDRESVGSCVGPIPALYRFSSPFVGPKTQSQTGLQHKVSNANSSKEANRANLQGEGQTQANHAQAEVSVAFSESDSAGTTAASVRRPFWKP